MRFLPRRLEVEHMLRPTWIALSCIVLSYALLGACDGSDGAGNDGGAAVCAATDACGGDIVGTWSVEDACVIETDFSALIGDQPACAGVVRSQEILLSGTL